MVRRPTPFSSHRLYHRQFLFTHPCERSIQKPRNPGSPLGYPINQVPEENTLGFFSLYICTPVSLIVLLPTASLCFGNDDFKKKHASSARLWICARGPQWTRRQSQEVRIAISTWMLCGKLTSKVPCTRKALDRRMTTVPSIRQPPGKNVQYPGANTRGRKLTSEALHPTIPA